MLQKGVYPYEYIDDWEQFIEALLPEKKKRKDFYSHLNIDHISNADWVHAKLICEDFKIKKLEK